VNAYEWASAVTIDAANNIFVVGTIPAISGITPEQAFVRKYDSGGNVLWENAGVAAASASVTTDGVGLSSVVTDTSGNIYSAGSAWGTVNYFDTAMSATVSVTGPGGQDAVLIKYDSSGVVQWVKMYGSASDENVTGGVKVDSTGAVYVSGWTRGSFGGSAQGGVDTFLFKVDASGNSLWTRQLGSANDDRINDMAIDASDNVYIAGTTGGKPALGILTAFSSNMMPLASNNGQNSTARRSMTMSRAWPWTPAVIFT
jgi:hypothetical protein